MSQIAGLDSKIMEMAARIKELRELEGRTPEQMAKVADVSLEEYLACESGERDLNFTFIYRIANALNVNVTDIIEGYSPNLRQYTMTRAGAGQKISQDIDRIRKGVLLIIGIRIDLLRDMDRDPEGVRI